MGAGKLIIISSTGFPGTTETWQFIQQAWREPLAALAANAGDKAIVTGVVNDGNNNYSAGYITYAGEILPFESGAHQNTVTIIETTQTATYDTDANNDGIQDVLPISRTRYAKFGTGGIDTFDFTELKRLKTLADLTTFAENEFVSTTGYLALTQAMIDKLENIEAEAEVNVQSNWNETSPGADGYIQNKPFNALMFTKGTTTMTNRKTSNDGTVNGDSNFNYAFVYPPSGYTVSNLVGFVPAISEVFFDGVVGDDDTLFCKYLIDYAGGRIKIYSNNTENRANAKVNWLAVWQK